MAALVRGEPNTPDKVNWFLSVDGVPTDAELVEFRIFDISSGLPGTQVFPVGGGYHPVSTGPGHFQTGGYYAYDNLNSCGWTPPLDEPLGTHRVEWHWRWVPGADDRTGAEDFEVVAQPPESESTYITVPDVRAAGITEEMADDATVTAYIALWQAFLDRACRQWFIPKEILLQVDGNNSDSLHFGVPVITVEYLKLNNSTTVLDPTYYRVYNSRVYPDDRRNPRIKLVGPSEYRDIYTAPLMDGRMLFRKGRKNQEIKGTFGFTEVDGSTPLLIKRALLKLVLEKLRADIPAIEAGLDIPPLLGAILEEETDGHRLKYAQAGGSIAPKKAGLSGMTTDPEVLDIIKLYRAPLGVATPSHWSYT